MKQLGLLFAILFCTRWAQATAWIDQSHAIFFPQSVASVAGSYERFPIFWWNFVWYDADADGDKAPTAREQICGFLQNASGAVTQSGCHGGLIGLQPTLADWVGDLPLRQTAPSLNEWRKHINSARAEASLPGSGALLWLFRLDPLSSYLDLKSRVENNIIDFEKNLAGKNVIPVQLAFAPSETEKTKAFSSALLAACPDCRHVHLLGPHASVLENETQVRKDLETVNTVGLLTFVALILFLFYAKRLKLLNIVLPLALAIVLGAVVTIAVYGSIHALTLAFGTGLVGLAVDYGLHSAFWTKAWRPNIYGLLTSLAVFAAAMVSKIPLLRQMMFFGAVGITIAFVILLLLFRFNEKLFVVAPFSSALPRITRSRFAVVLFCCAGLLYGALFMRPNFDLRLFDYQGHETRELTEIMKNAFAQGSPMLEVLGSTAADFDSDQERKQFAESKNIKFESVAKYIPPRAEQERNLRPWLAELCPSRGFKLSADDEEFAAPIFARLTCADMRVRDLSDGAVPGYVRHLHANNEWAHVWFPQNREERAAIQAQYPKAIGIDSMAEFFARALSTDMLIILPLAIFGVFLLLAIEFRKPRSVILASIPFFSGAGLMLWFFALMGWPISFMSLIGLVMVCGFSVDYGIFVTDALERGRLHAPQGLWSALSMCGAVTAGGFLPMAFGHHPVLRHLGFSLLTGAIGTYIGTIWGVLGFAKYVFKMKIEGENATTSI